MEQLIIERPIDVQNAIDSFEELSRKISKQEEIIDEKIEEYLDKYVDDECDRSEIDSILWFPEDRCKLLKYLTNGIKKSSRDIIRQEYVIDGSEIPLDERYCSRNIEVTKEQRKFIKTINMPYSIEEINCVYDEQKAFELIKEDVLYLDDMITKSNDKYTRIMCNEIINNICPIVSKKDVKEIHTYDLYQDEDILFLDEEGLHKVAGKKARVKFLNNDIKIGYLGSDFFDDTYEPCLSLFESYDEELGFYNYNLYKIKDILKVDVLLYRDGKITFDFELPIRDKEKMIIGVTDKM